MSKREVELYRIASAIMSAALGEKRAYNDPLAHWTGVEAIVHAAKTYRYGRPPPEGGAS